MNDSKTQFFVGNDNTFLQAITQAGSVISMHRISDDLFAFRFERDLEEADACRNDFEFAKKNYENYPVAMWVERNDEGKDRLITQINLGSQAIQSILGPR